MNNLLNIPHMAHYFDHNRPMCQDDVHGYVQNAVDFAAAVAELIEEIDALEHADVSAVLKKYAVVL